MPTLVFFLAASTNIPSKYSMVYHMPKDPNKFLPIQTNIHNPLTNSALLKYFATKRASPAAKAVCIAPSLPRYDSSAMLMIAQANNTSQLHTSEMKTAAQAGSSTSTLVVKLQISSTHINFLCTRKVPSVKIHQHHS
jgi:hypothetical protein